MNEQEARDAVARVIERLPRAGAQSGDVCFAESDDLETRVRDREIDYVKQAQGRTLGIRAFVARGEGLGSALCSTSDLSAPALDRMVDEAVALARATAGDPQAGLPGGDYAKDSPDLALHDPADRTIAIEARIDDAIRAEQAAREVDPRIVNSEGSSASSSAARWIYANTEGFVGEYRAASHSLFSEPIARADDAMQRDWAHSAARRLADLDDPAAIGKRAALRAVGRLGARQCKTSSVPVIFEPRAARSLIGHVATCANGSAIYREASCFSGRLGEQVASADISIVDDGRLAGGLASRPFDGEGQATRRNVIVKDGILTSYLLDHYAARKLGMTSTGSAMRGVAGSPSPGVTNMWLEAGSRSPESILADTSQGLLVTELIGMGFNPLTGDYSRGAAGYWIEGGEIAYPVEEITIAGRLDDMLTGIDRIGNDLEWIGPIASPTVRIAEMTVAGSSS